MSKMDEMRAMREASYAARASGAAPTRASVASRPTQPVKPLVVRPEPADVPHEVASTLAPDEELCGHRNMSGRTCTREQGHAAKSHRYS